jgi:hypothetical protein
LKYEIGTRRLGGMMKLMKSQAAARKINRHTEKGSVKKIMETCRKKKIVRIQRCNGEVPEINNNENKIWEERIL